MIHRLGKHWERYRGLTDDSYSIHSELVVIYIVRVVGQWPQVSQVLAQHPAVGNVRPGKDAQAHRRGGPDLDSVVLGVD